jgi:hypothetical protein
MALLCFVMTVSGLTFIQGVVVAPTQAQAAAPVWTTATGVKAVWHGTWPSGSGHSGAQTEWSRNDLYIDISADPGGIANNAQLLIVDRAVMASDGSITDREPFLSINNASGAVANIFNFTTMGVGPMRDADGTVHRDNLVAYFWTFNDGNYALGNAPACTGTDTRIVRIQSNASDVETACMPNAPQSDSTGGEVDQLTGKIYIQGGTNIVMDTIDRTATGANTSAWTLSIWDPGTGDLVTSAGASNSYAIQPGSLTERVKFKATSDCVVAGGDTTTTTAPCAGADQPYTTSDMALDASGSIYMYGASQTNHGVLIRVTPTRDENGNITSATANTVGAAGAWKYYVMADITPQGNGNTWGSGGGGMVGSAFYNGSLYIGGYNPMNNGSACAAYRSILRADPLSEQGTVQCTATPFFARTAGNPTGNTMVSAGGNAADDFASAQTAGVIQGTVYNDANGNGAIESNEKDGVPDQIIRLYDNTNKLIAETTTDSTGSYYFLVGAGAEGDDKHYSVRLVQPHINLGTTDAPIIVNAVQTWANGGRWVDTNNNGVTDPGETFDDDSTQGLYLNEVYPKCWLGASDDQVQTQAGGQCYGAKSPYDAADSRSGAVGSTSDPTSWVIWSDVNMQTSTDVADADFGITTATGSWGDAQTPVKSTAADLGPYHINIPDLSDSQPGIWMKLGDELGQESNGVNDAKSNDSTHKDDGLKVRIMTGTGPDDYMLVPVQGQTFSTGRKYTFQTDAVIASPSAQFTKAIGDVAIKAWASGLPTSTSAASALQTTAASMPLNGTPTATNSANTKGTLVGSAWTAPSGTVTGGYGPGVIRVNASTASNITSADNTGYQYAAQYTSTGTGSSTGNSNAWVTPGEIEDYGIYYASAQLRLGLKTVGGTMTQNFTLSATTGSIVGPDSPTSDSLTTTTPGQTVFSSKTHALSNTAAGVNVTSGSWPTGWAMNSVKCTNTETGADVPVTLNGNVFSLAAGTFTTTQNDITCIVNAQKVPDPAKSEFTLDKSSATVGTDITGTATVRDGNGDLMAGQTVTFSSDASDVTVTPATCTTGDGENGTTLGQCQVKITTDVANTYTNAIHAKVTEVSGALTDVGGNGDSSKASPKTVTFTADVADPAKSEFTISPAGPITVGQTYTVTVNTYDSHRNAVSGAVVDFSSESSTVKFAGTTSTSDDQCTTVNGTCTITFTSETAGAYPIHGKIGGTDIGGNGDSTKASPQTRIFDPGPCDPGAGGKSSFDVDKLTTEVGTNITLTVKLTDQFGNKCTPASGDTVNFTVSGSATPASGTATESPAGSGTYTATITDNTAEQVYLDVKLGSTVIAHSTETGHVATADHQPLTFTHGTCSAGSSDFDVNKLETPVGAGSADGVTFTVTVRDSQGNACPLDNPSQLTATTNDGNGSVTVSEPVNGTGNTYTFTVKDTQAETINVTVKLDGSNVAVKSGGTATANPQPIKFTAKECVATGGSSASNFDIDKVSTPVGTGTNDGATFTISLTDDLGNPCEVTDPTTSIKVTSNDVNNSVQIGEVTNGATTGTYTVRVKDSQAEPVNFTLKLNGTNLPVATGGTATNNPQTVTFTAGPCTAGENGQSYFDVDAISTRVGTGSSDGVTFTVTLLDAEGNACTPASGDTVTITPDSGHNATVSTLTETSPGSAVYKAVVKDATAETVPFTVKLGTTKINTKSGGTATDNPQPITFTEGSCSVGTSGTSNFDVDKTSTAVGTNATFSITLTDAQGNACDPATGETLSVTPSGSATASALTRVSKGYYTATVTDQVAETSNVAVKLGTQSINPKSGGTATANPQPVEFTAGPCVTGPSGTSTFTVDKTSSEVGTESGKGIKVTISLKDAYGNVCQPITASKITITENSSTATVSTPAAVGGQAGVYEATVLDTKPETVPITVQYDGANLKPVSPATANPQDLTFTQTSCDTGTTGQSSFTVDKTETETGTGSTDGALFTITLKDANGNTCKVDSSKPLTVTAAPGHQATVSSPTEFPTGSGIYTARVKDATAEEVPFSVQLGTDLIKAVSPATSNPQTIKFIATVPSDTTSSFTLTTGNKTVHTETHTVTVTLKDANGTAVDVDPSTLSGTASPEATVGTFTKVSGQTGVYSAPISSDKAGEKTVTITWSNGTTTITVPPATSGANKVTFVAGPAVGVLDTFDVTTGNKLTDGVAFHEAWVYIKDAYGNPREGDTVVLQLLNNAENAVQTADGARFNNADSGPFQATATADSSGKAVLQIYSRFATPSGKTGFPVRASLSGQYSVVKYVPFSPDTACPSCSTFTVTPTTSQVADGQASFAGTIALKDKNNLPVPGATTSVSICKVNGSSCDPTTDVTVTAADGSPANWVADSPNGEVNVKFTSTKAGEYRVTAKIGNDEIGASDPKYKTIVFTAGTADPAHSELIWSATPVAADGTTTNSVKALIRDAHDNVVGAGTSVVFAIPADVKAGSTSGPASVTVQTDATGTAQVDLTSTKAGEYTVNATVPPASGNIAINAPAKPQFKAGAADATQSQLSITTTGDKVADGVAYHTAQVEFKDANGNPATATTNTAHFCWTVTPEAGSPSAEQCSDATSSVVDGKSIATYNITSTKAGQLLVKATVGGNAVTPAAGVTANFVAGSPSESRSTLTSSTGRVLNNGTATHWVEATILDANDNPVKGVSVNFTKTGSAAFVGSNPVTTDTSGKARIELTDTTAETVQVSAIISQFTKGPASLEFGPGSVDPTKSTFTVSPAPPLKASDGTDTANQYTLTATLHDAADLGVAGETVSFELSGGTGPQVVGGGAWTCQTLSDGSCYIKVYSSKAGDFYVTAKNGGQVIPDGGQPKPIFFEAGAIDLTKSKLEAQTGTAVADNAATRWVKATIVDAWNNPISGATVDFTYPSDTSLGNSTVDPATTDSTGVAQIELKSAKKGDYTVSATAAKGSVTGALSPNVTVSFVAGAVDPSASEMTITTKSQTKVANGVDEHSVQIAAKDANGNAVGAGIPVTFEITAPDGTTITRNATTGNDGIATATWSSVVAGTHTVVGKINSVQVGHGSPDTAVFTPGAVDPTQSTFTVTSDVVVNNGIAQHAATVTAKDKYGNVIPGVQVRLTITTGLSSIDGPVFGQTISSGTATYNGTTADGTGELSKGQAKSPIVSLEEGTFTVEAFIGTGSGTSLGTKTVSFGPGAPSLENSSWTKTPDESQVVGTGQFTITVTVHSADDLPVGNAMVRLVDLGGTSLSSDLTVVEAQAGNGYWLTGDKNSDHYGQVVLHVKSSKAGDYPVAAQIQPSGSWASLTHPASYTLTYIAGAVDPDKSTFTVDPKTQVVGNSVKATFTVKDSNNQPLTDLTAADFNVIGVYNSGGVAGSPNTTMVAGSFDDNQKANGVYSVSFTSEKKGLFDISGVVKGVTLTHKEQVTFTASGPCLSNCDGQATYAEVTKPTAKANGTETTEVTVHVFDEFGNTVNGAKIFAVNDSNTALTPNPNNGTADSDGVYVVKWTSTQAGTFKGVLTVGAPDATAGVGPFQGSNPEVSYSPLDDPSATKSILTMTDDNSASSQVDDGIVEVAHEIKLTATVNDANGNPMPSQTVAFSVTTDTGAATSNATLSTATCTTPAGASTTGQCFVTVTSTVAGKYKVSGKVNISSYGLVDISGDGTAAQRSPKDVEFKAGSLCIPTASDDCDGHGARIAVTKDNQQANGTAADEVTLTTTDRYGNPVTATWAASVATGATVANASGTTPATGSTAGQSVIRYTSTAKGEYATSVTIGGQEVGDSPANLHFISGNVSAVAASMAPTTSQTVGSPFVLSVLATDGTGNGVGGVGVSFVLPSDDSVTVVPTAGNSAPSCTTNDQGVCSITVTSTKAQTASITVSSSPAASGSPLRPQWTAGSVDAAHTTVEYVNNGQRPDGTARDSLRVTAKDQYGNTITGAVVASSKVNAADPMTVVTPISPTDSNGVTQIYYTATAAGAYQADIKVDGVTPAAPAPSLSVPVTLNFSWAEVDPSKSSWTITPDSPLKVGTDAANTYTATVTARDANNQLIGDATFDFRLGTGQTGPQWVSGQGPSCTTAADGTCSVKIYSTKSGSFTLAAYNGTNQIGQVANIAWLPEEVCDVNCTPEPGVDPSHTTRYEVIRNDQLADDTASDQVRVYAYDKYGNGVPFISVRATSNDADLRIQTGIPDTADGSDSTKPAGTSVINFYSTKAKSYTDIQLRLGPTSDEKTPAGLPVSPALNFVAGAGCTVAPAGTIPNEQRTRLQVTTNGQTADGSAQDVVDVYVFDCQGNPVVTRITSIAGTQASPDANVTVVGSGANTDANGKATLKYSSLVSGDHQVSVWFDIAGTPTELKFFAQPPAPATQYSSSPATITFGSGDIDASKSSLTVDPTTQEATKPIKVTITAHDASDNPIKTLTASDIALTGAYKSGGASGTPDITSFSNFVNNNDGTYTMDITSAKIGLFEVSAAVKGTTLAQKPQVTFTSTTICVDESTCQPGKVTRAEMTKNDQAADGVATDEATVYVFDTQGNTVKDATIAAAGQGSVLTPASQSGKTGENGQYVLKWTAKTVGTYTATVTINGQSGFTGSTLSNINFVNSKICHPSDPQPCPDDSVPNSKRQRIEVTTDNAVANGTDADKLTVYVFDSTGNPVSTQIRSSKASGAGTVAIQSPIANTSATTGATTITYTTHTKGAYTVAVEYLDPSDGQWYPITFTSNPNETAPANWTSSPATINFKAGEVCISTATNLCNSDPDKRSKVVVTTDNQLANGTAEDGATVTLFDSDGNLVDGVVIKATTTDSGLTIGTIGKTNTQGVAVIPFTSTVFGPHTARVYAVIDGVDTEIAYYDGASAPYTKVPEKSSPVTVTFVRVGDVPAPTITSPKEGDVTNDSTPTISGTGEPGDTITVKDGDTVIGTTTVGSDGKWTYTPTTALSDGDHAITATQTDSAGNQSPATPPVNISVDTVKPGAPSVDTATATEISGTVDPDDGVTEVEVCFGTRNSAGVCNGETVTVTPDEDGNWTVPSSEYPEPPGTKIDVVAKDEAGNVSPSTKETLDTTKPDKPTVDEANADGVTGTAEPGTEVKVCFEVTSGTSPQCVTVPTDDEGNYTVPGDDIPDNLKQPSDVTVTATDPAGNTSDPVKEPIDTEAPDKPTIDSANADGVTGTAEPGSEVKVCFELSNGATKCVTVPADDETGEYTVPGTSVPSNVKQPSDVTVTATDPAGNTSDPATAPIDTSAPDAPVIETANATEIAGTAEPGSTVTVTLPTGSSPKTVTAPVDADGNWSVATPSGAKDGTIKAVATDPAGNVSDPATATLDRTKPSDPTVDVANGDEVSGTSDPGTDVEVCFELTNGQTKCETVKTDDNGNYTVPGDKIPDNVKQPSEVTVTAVDPAGNESDPVKVPIDTDAPSAPTVDTANGNGITGTVDPDDGVSQVEVCFGTRNAQGVCNGPTVVVTPDEDGNWAVDPEDIPDNPGNKIDVVAKDDAGNVSPSTKTPLDVTPPTQPTIDQANSDGIAGTVDPGEGVKDVEVCFGTRNAQGVCNGETVTVTPDEDGNWKVDPEDFPPNADGPISVVAKDDAGNTSNPAKANLDSDVPEPPSAEQTGPKTIGGCDATKGDTITVVYPDGTEQTTVVNGKGCWSVTIPDTVKDSDITPDNPIEVTETDPSGNTSEPTEIDGIDTTAPDQPTIDTANADKVEGTAPGADEVTVCWPDRHCTDVPVVDGKYSVDTPAGTKDGIVTVTAKDDAGNQSEPVTAAIDTTAPRPPVITQANDDGIAGKAEPGSEVQITLPAGSVAEDAGDCVADGNVITCPVDPSGNFEYPGKLPDTIKDGTLSAVTVDPAGNASTPKQADLDTHAAPPVIEEVTPGQVSGSGVEPGSTVTVTFPDGSTKTTTADDQGKWDVTPPAGVPAGEITAQATDPAGNVSTPVKDTLDVDTTAPDVVVDQTGPTTISGTTEPGSKVVITYPEGSEPRQQTVTACLNGLPAPECTGKPDGYFEATIPDGVEDGQVKIVATDPSGNKSDPVYSTLDTTGPDQPRADQGKDSQGNPVLEACNGEPGGTVEVTWADGTKSTGKVGTDGCWSVPIPQTDANKDGVNDADGPAKVVTKDKAGNASDPQTVTVDTTAPKAPTATQDGKYIGGCDAEPGATVHVDFPESSRDVVADDKGCWKVKIPSNVEAGDEITITQTDKAGNVSKPTVVEYQPTTAADFYLPAVIEVTTEENKTVDIDVLSHVTPQPGTYFIGSYEDPSNGTVSFAGTGQKLTTTVNEVGTFTYTPKADYDGFDAFTVSVKNSAGVEKYTMVKITVIPVTNPGTSDTPTKSTSSNPTTTTTVVVSCSSGTCVTVKTGGELVQTASGPFIAGVIGLLGLCFLYYAIGARRRRQQQEN